VIVVGAGLTGLACAHALARAGREVRVFEAARAPGGVVGSFEIDGFRFERGPNTVLASSPEFRRLAAELGLAERLVVSPAGARERYLWHRDRLHTLPARPAALFSTGLLSWRGKLRVASEALRRFRPAAPDADPDLAQFFAERLGPEAATRLAGAFVRGVYAAELAELGARSAFPSLWQACLQHGGLIRGLRRRAPTPKDLPGPPCSPHDLLSFEEGLGEMVASLAQHLGTRLSTNAPVMQLARAAQPRSGWSVTLAGGERAEAEVVVLALPAAATARLLATATGCASAADTLAAVGHARVTLVHLGFEPRELPGFPRGFGYLVPPDAGPSAPRVLGTIFSSNLFAGRAPAGCHGVTSFYATASLGAAWSASDVAHEACVDLARALRLPRAPVPRVTHVHAWDEVIPRYASGHRDRIDGLERELAHSAPGLHLAGNFSAGVSVEQVLARGRAVAAGLIGGSA